MSDLVMCDGVLMRAEEVRISPFDLGWTVGDGVFETLLVREGEGFAFSRHFARLQESAAMLGLDVPEKESLRTQAGVLVRESGLRRGRLRITLSAGRPEAGFSRAAENQRVLLTLAPLPDLGGEPARLVLSGRRRLADAISSRAKTLSYGENVWALREGKARGADEVLLENERGEVCEAAMANVFLWRDGTWWTPPLACGCLPGVTRALVMEILAREGKPVREEAMPLAVLADAEEIFLTNSLRGVWPASVLDGRDLACKRGENVAARYENLVSTETEP